MKIINKTKHNTDYFKRIFELSLKADNKIEGKFNKELIITIKYRRLNTYIINQAKLGYIKLKESYYYKGYAYYNTGIMRISLPKENINLEYIAKLFIHELQHCRGYKHSSMGYWLDYDVSFLNKL